MKSITTYGLGRQIGMREKRFVTQYWELRVVMPRRMDAGILHVRSRSEKEELNPGKCEQGIPSTKATLVTFSKKADVECSVVLRKPITPNLVDSAAWSRLL
ncbi:hypothetical protein GJ496_008345 [Pomphorhynchus laevis]|nr:hypothetical protein GJ496_008345 [Pomphorhynchus laevis]